MRSLQQCLLDLELVHLRYIARYWDLELTSSRRREVALELAQAMAVPETIQDAQEALPAGEKQALEMLLAAGGHMPLRIFTRQWGEIRRMGPGKMAREKPWDEPSSPAEGLWFRGFISRAFERNTGESYEAIFVPRELLSHLPTPQAIVTHIELKPIPAPNVIFSAGDNFLDDLCTLLAYAHNTVVQARADGTWPADHERRLRIQFRDSTHERVNLLHHIVRRLEWLQESDTKRIRPDPARVTAWLQSSHQEQREVVARAWRDDPTWNELFNIRTLKPENPSVWRNDPLAARQAILRHLKGCAPGTWYTINNFVTAVRAVDPDFQRPSGDYDTWYLRDLTTNEYLAGFESWNDVEGRLIHHIITGPSAWLGLADLGAETPGGPIAAFRITLTGAAFLGQVGRKAETKTGQTVLKRDFSVQIPAAQRYERFQLARVADWVSSGDTFTYRITPRSLERARQQGIAVTRVLDFLQRVTGQPVPRSVEAALTRWDARGVEAHIDQVLLLSLASSELLEQIIESPLSRELIQEQIGPTSALVRRRDWPRLAIALGNMGLLPDITIEEGSYEKRSNRSI